MNYELSPRVYHHFFQFSRINVFNLYSDFGSNFSSSYPSQITQSSIVYRQSHCTDLVNVRTIDGSLLCTEKYLKLIDVIHGRSNETNILDFGCEWTTVPSKLHRLQFHSIDCGCGNVTTFPIVQTF